MTKNVGEQEKWEVKQLNVNWDFFDERAGLLDVCGAYGRHWQHRDAVREAHYQDWTNPKDDCVYFQIDYSQHRSLPVGPEHSSAMYYRGARLNVTLLNIVVWHKGHRTYWTYCSKLKERKQCSGVCKPMHG